MTDFRNAEDLYETVATIFAVTVLLDNRERDRELIEFTHACMVHNHVIRPSIITARKTLLDWFESRKGEIKRRLAADDSEAYRRSLLEQIHDPELQRMVLSSIFTISVCDYELHDEESGFIQTALQVWGQDMPTGQELERVV